MGKNGPGHAALTNYPGYMRLTLPFPPSANHAWSTNRQGKRFLSKAGAAFKLRVKAAVLQVAHASHLGREESLRLTIELYGPFSLFFSTTWPEEAQHRHKQLDISNRIKLLEDAVFEALGLNDSQVSKIIIERFVLPEGFPEHVQLEVDVYEPHGAAAAMPGAGAPHSPKRNKRGAGEDAPRRTTPAERSRKQRT